MRLGRGKRLDLVLSGIVLLSAFLNIFNIWSQQYANAYYTTAVTSMLQSWHNFFYGSLDPGGYITVDKPPVTFWIQTAFAYVFGVHGWSVILPQALAGVGSVILMYVLVKPTFGRAAARLSALAMALTPVAVAVSRTNNIDSMLVFTLLLGAWMLFRGIIRRQAWWVIGAFAMIGVGFNMKMLQAYMVVPAFYLFYLLAFKGEWKKKLAVLAAASVVMVGVTLSWAVAVDLVPEENRPYIGGSDTNSVLELAFGYNGIARLKGMGRGGGGAPGGAPDRQMQQYGGARPGRQDAVQYGTNNTSNQTAQYVNNDNPYPQMAAPDGTNTSNPPQMPPDGTNMTDQQQVPSFGSNMTGQPHAPPGGANMPGGGDTRVQGRQGQNPGQGMTMPQGNRGGGMFNTGSAGPLRLLQSELSGQISWLLPFAAFAGVGLLAGVRRRKELTARQDEAIFWLAWLVPGMAFFSVAGFFHQYYLIMLAPPIAALAGAGAVELWHRYRGKEGWQKWLLPAAALATTALQVYILYPYQRTIGAYWPIGIGIAGAGLALALCLAMKKQKIASFAAASAVAVLLMAPLYWSATPVLYGDNSQLPVAGPGRQGFGGQRQGGGGSTGSSVVDTKLYQYVKSHNTGETYLFATTDTSTAETYIMQTGEAVMPMGGFNDSADKILTVEKMEKMIADKKVKFFLLGSGSGGGDRGGSGVITSWIISNSTEVPREEWQGGSTAQSGRQGGFTSGGTLYEINIGDEW